MMPTKSKFRNYLRKRRYHRKSSRYHERHRKQAMAAVNVIEKFNGGRLTNQVKKTIENYANEVLGSRRYAPWLYVYTLVRGGGGGFLEGWIPDNYFGKYVVPNLSKSYSNCLDLKTLSNVILNTEALPNVGYLIDGICYDGQFSKTNLNDFRKAIEPDHEFVFIKKDDSMRGHGVKKVLVNELTDQHIKNFGNCVLQSPITQHSFFEEFGSNAVATVRITTVKEMDGDVSMRAAYLRLGRKNSKWVEAEDSLRVAVVNDKGLLDSCCYTPDWRRWMHHPDNRATFTDKMIPNFQQAVEICTGLHIKLPHIHVIGWDVAIDEHNAVKIMECNGGHTDIKFSEATTGPCFVGLNWERFKDFSVSSKKR